MNQEEYIKMKIMRQVYFLYYAKKFFRPTTLQVSGLAFLVALEAFFVSFKHVIENASGISISGWFSYFFSAFMNTELSVKIITIGILLVALVIAYRPAKSLGGSIGSRVYGAFGFLRAS